MLAECDPAGGDVLSGYLAGLEIPATRGLLQLAVADLRDRLVDEFANQLIDLDAPKMHRLVLPGIGDRLLTLTEAFSGPTYAADQSLVERSNVGTVALKVFELNPIFGTGPSTFRTVVGQYAPLSGAGSIGDITATHNLYLEMLVNLGPLGLGAFLCLSGSVVRALGQSIAAGWRR